LTEDALLASHAMHRTSDCSEARWALFSLDT
jgi:hypothetical protein